MAIYNTDSDSANTAVRAFLTKLGEHYLERRFNTGSGKGKRDWLRIKESVFENRCAYCGITDVKLSMEHLVMFNRAECGLHHPGNIVPCCTPCNKRARDAEGRYVDWKSHLILRSKPTADSNSKYQERLDRILRHIADEGYPNLSSDEKKAIEILAQSLYDSVKAESSKALNIYSHLDQALIQNR